MKKAYNDTLKKGEQTDIWLMYRWEDEEGFAISETMTEYFDNADALFRRMAELKNDYATIVSVHAPLKAPPVDGRAFFV